MKLGISSYTYTWAIESNKMNVFNLVEKAAALKVGVVQICDNLPLHKLSLGEMKDLRDFAYSMGISIEVGIRGAEPELLKEYLNIAKYLNSNILRTILHKQDGILTIEEAYKNIKYVMPQFEGNKVKLAIENHEKHKVKELAALIEMLNSPYAGICLDTVNSFGALESPEEVLKVLVPYTINLHYKDFDIVRQNHQMGFSVVGTIAGKGRLNIEDILKKLISCSCDPNVILELWTPFTQNMEVTINKENEWAVESINYLKEWIK